MLLPGTGHSEENTAAVSTSETQTTNGALANPASSTQPRNGGGTGSDLSSGKTAKMTALVEANFSNELKRSVNDWIGHKNGAGLSCKNFKILRCLSKAVEIPLLCLRGIVRCCFTEYKH